MIKEAAASALKNVLKTYIKPAARKIAKAGVKAARGGAHRGVNSIANSGEKALLALIGEGLTLPGQRRRTGGRIAARIPYAPARVAQFRSRAGGAVRLATKSRRR
jgi:hypothetical protein